MKQMLAGYMILIAPIQVYAGQNMGGLSISVGTASTTTYSQVLVVDPLGRKTGFDPGLKHRVKDIPGSSYVTESIDSYDGIFKGDESAVFAMNNPIQGTYYIVLVGLGNANYSMQISAEDYGGKEILSYADIYTGSISLGASQQYSLTYNPVPGTPAPVITKTVTFDVLRNDISVARQLNQLGDDKFARSLTKNIDLAEMLAGVCGKRKGKKEKPCQPAIAVLKLFVKRLELANRKCDNPSDCDEEREWAAFRKEHGKDDDYKDFFREWDRDDWHKHKKKCRRFVTDEALKIIGDDTGWLIKSLGEKTGDEHGKPGHGGHGGGKGGKD